MNRIVREPVELNHNNNGVKITSSTSSTESSSESGTAPQKEAVTLPQEMGIPSTLCLTMQNIDRSKIEHLGHYGTNSAFQMMGQPTPTRIPEVPTSKTHDCTPAMQENLNKPSTSFSPLVEDIPENETKRRIVTSHTSYMSVTNVCVTYTWTTFVDTITNNGGSFNQT